MKYTNIQTIITKLMFKNYIKLNEMKWKWFITYSSSMLDCTWNIKTLNH